jgi:hypothetical protein
MAETIKQGLTPEETRVQKLKKEPRVKVYGNEIFQDQLGEVYTFLYNALPVTIKFDGSYQEYPESVAKLLESKLSEIAKANTRKTINTRIG